MIEKKTPNPKELKSAFNELTGRKQYKQEKSESIISFLNEYIRENSNSWTESTLKKLNNFKNHISDYNKNATFKDIDEDFLAGYTSHLRDKKQFQNSTIHKHHKIFKAFLNWITDKGYNSNENYKRYKLKLKTLNRKIIFLNWKELMSVYHLDIPKELNHLEKVRDIFCFCCFTSLRYSDVHNLKISDITDTTINIITVKTTEPLVIDLNKYSKSILKKYDEYQSYTGKALPVISNQKMNDYIKEVGKLAQIDTPVTISYLKGNKRLEETYPKYALLTTHVGRRTFICNALALGIPPNVVMKWTGHSDYKAMEPYIDVADETKIESMNKFNKKKMSKKEKRV